MDVRRKLNHQQSHNFTICNTSLENVSKFKFLSITLANVNASSECLLFSSKISTPSAIQNAEYHVLFV